MTEALPPLGYRVAGIRQKFDDGYQLSTDEIKVLFECIDTADEEIAKLGNRLIHHLSKRVSDEDEAKGELTNIESADLR